jgi:hypothetical protein
MHRLLATTISVRPSQALVQLQQPLTRLPFPKESRLDRVNDDGRRTKDVSDYINAYCDGACQEV